MEFLKNKFDLAIEKQYSSVNNFIFLSRWLALRTELATNLFIIGVCFVCFYLKNQYEDKERLTYTL